MPNITITELPATIVGKQINELPSIVNALGSDIIPAYQASTGRITVAQMLALVIDGASSSFNTLQKLEVGKLSVDGSDQMDSDLDLGGFWLANHAAKGMLVREPQIITSTNPSWPYHARTKFAIVDLWGAGGAGGGIDAGTSGTARAGNGGTSGAYCRKFIDVTALAARTANIQIGAAGTGVSGSTGGNGGASSYVDEDITLTANGGNGGAGSTGASEISSLAQATLPLATGGDINVHGSIDYPLLVIGATTMSNMLAQSGNGGNSRFGVGGLSIYMRSTTGTSSAGNNASGFAAGGGGAICISTGGARAGGNGAPGLCIIYEFA